MIADPIEVDELELDYIPMPPVPIRGGEDGKLRGVTFIPRAMVVEMVEIGRPRARKAKTCVSSATPDSSTS